MKHRPQPDHRLSATKDGTSKSPYYGTAVPYGATAIYTDAGGNSYDPNQGTFTFP